MTEDKNILTHFDDSGNAVMVDVGQKVDTHRIAVASGKVRMGEEAYSLVKSGSIKKGDVLGVARLAGIMAAKKVDSLIPLTHPLMITKATVEFNLLDEKSEIEVIATVGISGKTGVEMEALTAVSVAALTIYDMCKAVDKKIEIDNIKLLRKSGGRAEVFLAIENIGYFARPSLSLK